MLNKIIVSLGLFGICVNAFPRVVLDSLADPTLAKRAVAAVASPPQGTGGALPLITPPFDPEQQYVSTTGKYAWVAPTATDERGECPGLNAMANHGYLPHSGIGTIKDFATACETVYGMSPDLATFLAVYGAVVDGTLTSWSVGGTPHLGIGGAHGNYESDSSALYGDLHQYGSSQQFVPEQFNTLYSLQPDSPSANYNLDVMRNFRLTRFQQSVQNNPKFFYNVFSGTVVTQAGYIFIYRFFANKSAEYPEGTLNKNVLRNFYSVWYGTEEEPEFKFGHERIPDNWYKRNAVDLYSVPYLEADILYYSQVTPEIPFPGCNDGEVNTYRSLDPATLTNGVFTKEKVAAQPLCFSLQYTHAFLPALTGLASTLLSPLTNAISALTSQLGDCPAISSIDNSALEACPGFALFGGPTGPIAPGATPN